MCVDIVCDWSRYDPRSLVHGKQITIITDCDIGYCGSFDHGFGAKGDVFHLGGVHVKLVLHHSVIETAKGVLQDPDGIGLCTDITYLIGIMKHVVICEPINKYFIMF